MRPAVGFPAAVVLVAFLAGCGKSEFGLSCGDPAPLAGSAGAASTRLFIRVIDDVDLVTETERMQSVHGFYSSGLYEFARSFSAGLTPSQLASVRCDPVVAAIYGNGLEAGLPCADPAPCGWPDPGLSPQYIISVEENLDVVTETHRMEIAYGFAARDILDALRMFTADLTPAQVATVACDDAVWVVSGNIELYPN